MKTFKNMLIVILIPTGLFILGDVLFGFQHQHPDNRWLRLPALFFWLSALIYTVVFKAVKADKK